MSCECSKALRLMKVTLPPRRDGPEQPTEWGGVDVDTSTKRGDFETAKLKPEATVL